MGRVTRTGEADADVGRNVVGHRRKRNSAKKAELRMQAAECRKKGKGWWGELGDQRTERTERSGQPAGRASMLRDEESSTDTANGVGQGNLTADCRLHAAAESEGDGAMIEESAGRRMRARRSCNVPVQDDQLAQEAAMACTVAEDRCNAGSWRWRAVICCSAVVGGWLEPALRALCVAHCGHTALDKRLVNALHRSLSLPLTNSSAPRVDRNAKACQSAKRAPPPGF
ncbi:hypothetical protein L1887_48965 [Cichorium endivia]|nr:hypothetical protein L1887_48965 [Cichorium endivia]